MKSSNIINLGIGIIFMYICFEKVVCFETDPEQKAVLLEFYNATGGNENKWIRSDGWNNTLSDPCADFWFGIKCIQFHNPNETDTTFGQILSIELSENGLTTVAAEKGSIFSQNFFSTLKDLKYFDLSENPFLNELLDNDSVDLSSSPSLQRFSISGCSFSGQLPSLPKEMLSMQAAGNKFMTIDESIWSHTKLIHLDISDNSLVYEQLPEFKFSRIQNLIIKDNSEIKGSIDSLKNLIYLNNFDASNCGLDGVFPKDLRGFRSSIKSLNLHNNNLKGSLEGLLVDANRLFFDVDLSFNDLNGSLDFLKGWKVRNLDLRSNNFEGTFPSGVCDQISAEKILISDNKLDSGLDNYIGCFGHSTFDISSNRFSDIPSLATDPSIADKLKTINWSRNRFDDDDDVFSFLAQFKALETIDLSSNAFIGHAPVPKKNTRVVYYDISENKFEGQFNSQIPDSWSKTIQYFDASDNSFDGPGLPNAFSQAKRLEVLRVADNKLTGEVPSWLTGLSDDVIVDLTGNAWSCPIPKQLPDGVQVECTCKPGEAAKDPYSTCLPCEPGTYSPNRTPAGESCLDCPEGTTSFQGASQCRSNPKNPDANGLPLKAVIGITLLCGGVCFVLGIIGYSKFKTSPLRKSLNPEAYDSLLSVDGDNKF